MTFPLIMQAIANGLAMGGLYILIALGLTLLLSIMKILQLAHGEVYMIGAYVVYYLATYFGFSLFLSILISMGIMALFGVILERVLFRPCGDDFVAAIVVSIGLTMILQSFAVSAFGLFERSIPRLARGAFSVMGVALPKDRLMATAIAALLSLLLYVFLKKTKFGQALVASAQNAEAVKLRGVNPKLTAALSMAIACALAAVGGAMAGSILMLTPFMGTLPLVKGLIIIVIGGMGSLFGAIVGGILLGLIDGVFPVLFGPVVASIAPLAIVVLVLLIKPQGLFGHDS